MWRIYPREAIRGAARLEENAALIYARDDSSLDPSSSSRSGEGVRF